MFINDEEKMLDFINLGKEEFLATYSYIKENEYIETLLVVQFLKWLEKRNKKTTKKIELVIAFNIIIFIADKVRWSFNYDHEENLICLLQNEKIVLNNIIESNVIEYIMKKVV